MTATHSPLLRRSPARYIAAMKNFLTPTLSAARFALVVLALGAGTGVAFAAWLEHGAGIVHTLGESGLAWCF